MTLRVWLRARKHDVIAMETKDWIGAISAVMTTILAGVSVWLAASVGTLQEYYQSEIVSRNSQVTAARRETDALEQRRLELVQQIAQLTDDASAAKAQKAAADQKLAGARERLSATEAQLQQYARETTAAKSQLDIRLRAEAYQRLSWMAYSLSYRLYGMTQERRDENAAQLVELGSLLQASLKRAQQEPSNSHIRSYLDDLVNGMPQSCPDVLSTTVSYPAIPKEASPETGNAQADLDESVRLIGKEYELFSARIGAKSKDLKKFAEAALACGCSVLATGADRSTVCGGK